MTDIVVLVAVVVVIALVVIAMVMAEKSRQKALLALGEQMGLAVNLKPDRASKGTAFEALGSAWRDLRTGASGVTWCMNGTYLDRPVTILQHRFSTGSGKSRQTHYHTVAATPAPANWPAVTLSKESVFHKIGAIFGSKDFQLDDAAFNARWRISTTSEDFTLLALTPDVQQWSMTLPRDAMIRVGGGAITVARRVSVKPADVPAMAGWCVELSGMIPEELDHWTPA